VARGNLRILLFKIVREGLGCFVGIEADSNCHTVRRSMLVFQPKRRMATGLCALKTNALIVGSVRTTSRLRLAVMDGLLVV
jgi:hypothetical protein